MSGGVPMNAKQRRRVYAHARKLERQGKIREYEIIPWADKAEKKNAADRIRAGQFITFRPCFNPKTMINQGPAHVGHYWARMRR
jgi:hypothetical protein